MTGYDFDKPIDRTGSYDLKHVCLAERWNRTDLLPLWVADMDWETPPFITEALRKRLEHSLYGYTTLPEDYWQVVIRWVKEHHGWQMQPEWMSFIPGIVKGIGMAICALLSPGDKVIIQPPVYHPFRLVPQGYGHEVVMNPLKRQADGYYDMDFEHLAQVADERCRLFILCNPHNPAGICWPRETLERLARFCYERNILVISDEIHCDMALYGHHHIPFASVSREAEQNSITFAAPSKTFNMAGLVSSWAAVPNEQLRSRFFGWMEAGELNEPTLMAPIATLAAFTQGEEWRRQMLRYVEGNIEFVIDYCRKNIPAIRPLRPQASFLVWLDCRNLNLSHAPLQHLFVGEARLALNDGEMFGPGGEGFMRLNVGTQRAVLQKAMDSLAQAVARMQA
ncbi:MAG: MalY/PatB family protein [Bacteroidaceae bacterium]